MRTCSHHACQQAYDEAPTAGSCHRYSAVPFLNTMRFVTLLRYTYLDTHGRPVLVLRLKDTVDEHGGPFTVCTHWPLGSLLVPVLLQFLLNCRGGAMAAVHSQTRSGLQL